MAKTFLKMSPKIVGRVIRIPEPKTIIVRRAMNYRHPKYDVNMRRYRDFHVSIYMSCRFSFSCRTQRGPSVRHSLSLECALVIQCSHQPQPHQQRAYNSEAVSRYNGLTRVQPASEEVILAQLDVPRDKPVPHLERCGQRDLFVAVHAVASPTLSPQLYTTSR
jgi:hypothetical protein